MALSCCKKFVSIAQLNNIKSKWRLLLFKLLSLVNHRKKRHEKVCYNHDHCHIEMPNEDNKTLKYNHGQNSLKAPAIIYPHLEYLLEKMRSCQNNPEKSYTGKLGF